MQSHNVDIARRYLGELWSRGRLEAVHELVAPSCTVHDPFFGDRVGADAIEACVREMRRAFPGLTWRIDEVLVDAGPQLALTWSATTRSIKVSGLMLLRFDDGKLSAITARWDPHGLFAVTAEADDSDVDAHWDD